MQKQRDRYENKIKELSLKYKTLSSTPTTTTPNSTSGQTSPTDSNPSIVMNQQFESYMKKMQDEQSKKEQEFEKKRQDILMMQKKLKRREILSNRLKKILQDLSVMIEESNLISDEMKRKVRFSSDLIPGYYDDHLIEDVSDVIRVKVENMEKNQCYLWDYGKFNDRYYLFKEKLETFFDKNCLEEEEEIDNSTDPFWDPNEHVDIARAYISVKPLVYLFDNRVKAFIYYENYSIGTIDVTQFLTI